MEYIVMDLEWNIAKRKREIIRYPELLRGEIIQIGAVKLTENLEVVDTFNRIIKPVHYPKMNKRIQEITLITDQDLATGMSLADATAEFKAWCGTESILLTWGEDDVPMLAKNLQFEGMDSDWIPECFNAQWMFDDQITMENRQFSLDYARYTFDIKGRDAHDALNDAWNTAEVIQRLEVRSWIQEEREYQAQLAKEEAYAS